MTFAARRDMGIDVPAAQFLAMARANDVDFSTTLTLGRQSRVGRPAQLVEAMQPFGVIDQPDRLESELAGASGWADPVFTSLGAGRVDALDRSSFEGAEILHDLNEPLPDDLDGHWSCVVDGGLSEHIFDFPTALTSSMRLVAPGGHLVAMVPTNQQTGHGFYQVGPEAYFRSLIAENGYRLRGVFLHEETPRGRWFRVPDPAEVGHRVTVATVAPAMLYVVARRIGQVAGLSKIPQQADYSAAWEDGSVPVTAATTGASRRRGAIVKRVGPTVGRTLQLARQTAVAIRGSHLERVDLRRVELPFGRDASVDVESAEDAPPRR
jgi:hypothetical protein